MKKVSLLLLVLCCTSFLFGQYEADEKVNYDEISQDDIYLAGGEVSLNAKVHGDVIAAGGEVTFNDSISQDLTAAGGEIEINSPVGDDIRVAGGQVVINSNVADDVVVFGGELTISDGVVIHGNLLAFGGQIEMNGTVNGLTKIAGGEVELNGTIQNLEVKAGEVQINGMVQGTSSIAAGDINIGNNAKFHGNVTYWTEKGELNFKNSLVNATATFDDSLAWEQDEVSWVGLGFGVFMLWICFILAGLLIIMILNRLFKDAFIRASRQVNVDLVKSLGYGLIYLIGVPLLIVLACALIIGIPIGIFMLFLYIFSLVFAQLVMALIIAHLLNIKKNKSWSYWQIVFVALLIAIGLRIVTLIPILGFIISIGLIAIAYGSILLSFQKDRNSNPVVA